MRVFFDTNVILDVLIPSRPSSKYSIVIFEALRQHIISAGVSTQSIVDAAYVSSRAGVNDDYFKRFVKELYKISVFEYLDSFDMIKAADSSSRDFEDEAQFAHASSGEFDALITSDKIMKKHSEVPGFLVFTPEEFVAKMRD